LPTRSGQAHTILGQHGHQHHLDPVDKAWGHGCGDLPLRISSNLD
jgi:hypothetical protein